MLAASVVSIAEHSIGITTTADWIDRWIRSYFQPADALRMPDLSLYIEDGYGTAFHHDHEVAIDKTEEATCYLRADYHLRIDKSVREAHLQVHDELALKHALINLYSAFIVHGEWGLLIHSSCVVESGRAFLFAGYSGAGKSTVARLSSPRHLLADEAALVRIPRQGNPCVYDSPFRSELLSKADTARYPIAGIHLLRQSERVERTALTPGDAFLFLMDKVFYWAHDANETAKAIRLVERIVKQIPTYDLHFRRNDSFWELIS